MWWELASQLLKSQLAKNASTAAKGEKISSGSQALSAGQVTGAVVNATDSTTQGGQGGTDTGMQNTPNGVAPTWSPYQDNGQLANPNLPMGMSAANNLNSQTPNPSAVAMANFAQQQSATSPEMQFQQSLQSTPPTSKGSFLGGFKKGGLGMPQSETDTSPWFYAGALIPSVIRAKLGVDTTMEAAQRQKIGNYYASATLPDGTTKPKKNTFLDSIIAGRKPGQKVFLDEVTGEIIYQ